MITCGDHSYYETVFTCTFNAAKAIAFVWRWGSTDDQTRLAIEIVNRFSDKEDVIDVLMDVITGLKDGFLSEEKSFKEVKYESYWTDQREQFDWIHEVTETEDPKDLLTLAIEHIKLEWAESLIRNDYKFIEAQHVFDARQSKPMKAVLDLESNDKLNPPLTPEECEALERIKREIASKNEAYRDLFQSEELEFLLMAA